MSRTVSNIKTPDLVHLPGGLNIGSYVELHGMVLPSPNRFSINLQNSDEQGCDIPFHFDIRNDEQSVVRNSFENGGWGTEERGISAFSFLPGSMFHISIFVGPESYSVYVHGAHYIEFKHRLRYQDVRYLRLSEGAQYFDVLVHNKAKMPYVEKFPNNLKPRNAVRVRGAVNDNATRFGINFIADSDRNTIGFHFNPRCDIQETVLNTFDNGNWGVEERVTGDFPFNSGEFFDIVFALCEGYFQVFVNFKLYATYQYRIPVEKMQYFDIKGDCTIMDVEYLEELEKGYIRDVPNGVGLGDVVRSKLYFPDESDSFALNLLTGNTSDSDYALHVNPRRSEGEVVLNTKKGGLWGEEVRHPLPDSLKTSTPVVVCVAIREGEFLVFLNNVRLPAFKMREDCKNVRGILGYGPQFYEMLVLEAVEESVYVDRLPAPLSPDSWVMVTGRADDDPQNITVNLLTAAENGDEALHIDARFNENAVVRNSRINGSWGTEERTGPFPFTKGGRMQIIILVKESGFSIYVNGDAFAQYKHRMDPALINHIQIKGDCVFLEPGAY